MAQAAVSFYAHPSLESLTTQHADGLACAVTRNTRPCILRPLSTRVIHGLDFFGLTR